ncbi:MAG: ArsR/SmtB family transcription factor [Phycisphaerales bacterium JB052]
MPPAHTLTPIEHLREAAQCLKVISHPVRLQMIEMLLDHRLSVGEVAEATNTPQNVTSEHLKRLREHGLIAMERDGRRVICWVIEPGMRSIIQCVQARYRMPASAETDRKDTKTSFMHDMKGAATCQPIPLED